MEKLKSTIAIIFGVLIASFLIYCMVFCFTHEARPKYVDCGKIISKSNDEVVIKYGVRTELYLNIEFDKSGFRSIETEPSTYFKYQVGDSICWNLNAEKPDSYHIFIMIGLMSTIITVIALIVLLIYWLFKDWWNK